MPGTAARSPPPSTVAEKVCLWREANRPSHPEGKYRKTDKVMQRNEQGSPKVEVTERRGWVTSTIAIFMPCMRGFALTVGTRKEGQGDAL